MTPPPTYKIHVLDSVYVSLPLSKSKEKEWKVTVSNDLGRKTLEILVLLNLVVCTHQ